MEYAKVYEKDGYQFVDLPEKFQLKVNEVMIEQYGDALVLRPKDDTLQSSLGHDDNF